MDQADGCAACGNLWHGTSGIAYGDGASASFPSVQGNHAKEFNGASDVAVMGGLKLHSPSRSDVNEHVAR